ncbi:hypothetical protein MYO4S_00266 [Serratia phage 4S]|nr:hypothetical protein MYO4S_00266 [Serratia phage 4S]
MITITVEQFREIRKIHDGLVKAWEESRPKHSVNTMHELGAVCDVIDEQIYVAQSIGQSEEDIRIILTDAWAAIVYEAM